VGAGFAGCTIAERIATQLNKKVLIVEQRNHIGGNCYDYKDSNGIIVHKYGPHAFHTNMRRVWDYVNQFSEFNTYEHKVLAMIDGKKVPVPFNINSIEKIFPKDYAKHLNYVLLENYGKEVKIPILKLRETKNSELKDLAEFIYKNIFLGYTTKQWGFGPEELDFSVSSRVPVYISRDDRYFQDAYQGMPINGYTKLFERMTESPNIEIVYNTDYKDILNTVQFDKLVYTGQIDRFFDCIHGELPYRSLEFDFQQVDTQQFQETAQVNFPNEHDYTRITEFNHFYETKAKSTTIAYEYPKAYKHGLNDPYYPIPKAENDEIFKKYQEEAKKIENTTLFVGRLAEYKYYNMEQIIGVALMMFEKNIAEK
jgi:UDP-galactopyranose mutase